MNRIGIHYAYWTQNWNTDFVKAIQHAAKLGFNAMDITAENIMPLPREKRGEIRRIAQDLDLSLAFVPATGAETDIACPDAAIRKNGVDYFKRCIEFTSEMGSNILAGIIYSAWQAPFNGITDSKAEARERSLESLSQILPVAEDFGVYYCLEIVNRFEQYLLNTAREGVDFAECLNHKSLRLLLDTFHMNIEEDSLNDAIKLVGNLLGHFHIGECNRRVPGTGGGRMLWDEIFGALKEIGYTGSVIMEPFVKSGGEVGNAISVWRDLVPGGADKLDANAVTGLNFVKNYLL